MKFLKELLVESLFIRNSSQIPQDYGIIGVDLGRFYGGTSSGILRKIPEGIPVMRNFGRNSSKKFREGYLDNSLEKFLKESPARKFW